ncbi:Ig-like domain-containing protein, partial [Methylobacterium sp. E-041]|uniref:Ig-like domain-containing protein n=1 Tax=Methylobacterium sp. E-041 TaxID=2836573 RepID=UPI001FBBC883
SFTIGPQVAAPSVALTSDTGASYLDGITRAGGLTITGVETGATLLYSVAGGPASAIYDPPKLVESAHTLLLTQTAVAVNTSTASSLSFTLDTKVAAPSVALTSDTGASSLDGITRAGGLTITGVETGATLLYSVDGGLASASYDPTKLLDGAHTVLVTQTDVAGNTSTASSLSFTLDTKVAAPSVALTSDTGASSLDGITRAGGLTITGVEIGTAPRCDGV